MQNKMVLHKLRDELHEDMKQSLFCWWSGVIVSTFGCNVLQPQD